MKLILSAVLLALALAGCNKNNEVVPYRGALSASPGDTPELTADDSLHMPVVNARPQLVNTTVSGKSLILKFNENVNILLTAKGYNQTSAVHLLEDFKNSSLAGVDYMTVAEQGNTTFNWVDDNLNNVVSKTISDTVIDNEPMVKINVRRVFTFTKIYDSPKLAADEQTVLVNKLDDILTFSSYCYFKLKNYPATLTTANVVYLK